jgi:hypothetical protein
MDEQEVAARIARLEKERDSASAIAQYAINALSMAQQALAGMVAAHNMAFPTPVPVPNAQPAPATASAPGAKP